MGGKGNGYFAQRATLSPPPPPPPPPPRHKDQDWEKPASFKPDPRRVEAKRQVPAAWDSTRPYVTWAASSEGMAAHKTRRDKAETSRVGNRSMSTKVRRQPQVST